MRATGKLRVFGKATEEKISKKNTKRYMILHKFGYVLCREPDKEERRKCVRQADGGEERRGSERNRWWLADFEAAGDSPRKKTHFIRIKESRNTRMMMVVHVRII